VGAFEASDQLIQLQVHRLAVKEASALGSKGKPKEGSMFVEVRGHKFYCEDVGEGRNVPVVFLHGFPLSSEIWLPLRDTIAGQWRFLAPDLRGFGRSDKPEGPYTMDTLAEDVLGIADALGIQRFVLAGHSMGGYVAFRIVARAPERILGLALICTRAEPDTEEARARRRQGMDVIRTRGPGAFLDSFLPSLVGGTTKATRQGVLDRLREIASGVPDHVLAACLAGMMERPDSRPLLPEIRVPVLVVAGDEDALIPPDHARSMAEQIPFGRFVLLQRCGHTPSLEVPEEFTREVEAFLRSLQQESR